MLLLNYFMKKFLNLSTIPSFKINQAEKNKNTDTVISPSNILRSEFNFLKYPFFDISSKSKKKDQIEIKIYEETDKGIIEILWKVSRHINSDIPSSFARRIHKKIVEEILNNIKKPVPRLIRVGSLRQICIKMGIAISGKNTKEIKKALKDIASAKIETKRSFRLKEKNNGEKKFFEGLFNLYDGVFFSGEKLPDGKEAETVYILLSDYYVQNFNNNFVVPLDYNYYQSIKGDLASRMYEILSLSFYPALERKELYIQKNYSELCDYFPFTRQDKKWKAKKQLRSAHNQHLSSGFLKSDPEWQNIGKKDDWLIRYYIGPKAESWYYSIKNGKRPLDIIEQSEDIKRIEDRTNETLLNKLLSLKIPQKKAEYLIKNYDNIENWLDALNLIKPKNSAGFLVKALEEKWELPEELRKKKTGKDRKKKEKLMSQYYESIFKQVDEHLCRMDKSLVQEELKQHKEIFLNKYPKYREFEKNTFLNPFIEQDYKKSKIEELGLLSFAQWEEQRL